ncbi:MAG: hypothetical protein NVSMB1_04840 [Polyangiales bacterium]
MIEMSESEREVMIAHVGYWRNLLNQGVAIVFGPVADPKGGWGVGIVEVDGKEALTPIEANDPAILAGLGMRYEVLPMLRAVTQEHG